MKRTLALLLALLPQMLAAAPPNVLLIVSDDQGYRDLGCFDSNEVKTPHLDRLAAQGIRFTDFYSTSPVCSPSRVGLLTGRTPNRAGVYDWIPSGNRMHMGKNEFTMSAMLKRRPRYAVAPSSEAD